jgi:hypothetical protein
MVDVWKTLEKTPYLVHVDMNNWACCTSICDVSKVSLLGLHPRIEEGQFITAWTLHTDDLPPLVEPS